MQNIGCLLALSALLASSAQAAEHWRLQYFHDSETSSLNITDLQFPSPQRGMAIGYIFEGRRSRPSALVTSDGGRTWTAAPSPGIAVSLFFLNDNLGWLVTKDTLWQTTEFGRNWKKLGRLPGLVRVYFRDENHGWAAGAKKSVYETSDGGRKWTRLAAGDQPKSNPDYTVYDFIAFANAKLGMIAGWSKPPRRRETQRVPDWIDPESRRREWPTLMILLETRDGGQHWAASETSMFGQVTRIRLAPDGRGLGLIEFFDAFDWPSEVIQIDWRTGKNTRVFRRIDRAVTDIALPSKGPAYLAAVEPLGTLARSPVPGKLKILRSENFQDWVEMPVDYRAVARHAILAVADPANLWVATDTGMILKLVAE